MATAETRPPPEDPAGPNRAGRTRRAVRGFLLDTGQQLRLASYLLAVATALSAGLGWMLWRAYRETSQLLELADPSAGATLWTKLAHEDRFQMILVAAGLVLVLACLLGAVVMVTHRIAGPAHAIGRTCRQVADGDLTEPPPLHSLDLLRELGDDVAAMVKVLREREARERDVLGAAAQVLRDPFAAAPTRRELASHLESLAAAKKQRLRP